jgi:cytidine deaminase
LVKNPKKRANLNKLLSRAREVRGRAYAPYSNYRVGAAIRGASGKVYTGVNVENASYGLTVCAERNAVFKAISEGEHEFTGLAVVTENGGSPCGACRQVIYEFFDASAPVALGDAALEHVQETTVGGLLPDGFSPKKLREGQQKSAKRKKTKK